MKFYHREKELNILTKTNLTAVIGRRRIGKTRLLEEAYYRDKEISYIFIANTFSRRIKNGKVLCVKAADVCAGARDITK